MTDYKIGDRVKSTKINGPLVTISKGTILEIDYDGNGEAIHAFVQQDDGITAWWGL